MKVLHFECTAGISGDMTLGALVDLGVDPGSLRAELAKLGLEGWKLEFQKDERGGITGTRALVDTGEPEHDHHHHEHEHHHQHTTWKEIRGIIEKSAISAGAKKRALAIFTRIAEAEAQVHGRPVDEVAFHEVGAMDSIIDIVGAAVCLDMLAPDRVTCGEVELGGGTARCAHGILPVPAPATVLLVKGMPVKTGGFNKEMTTPTGAAILAASVDEFVTGQSGPFIERKTGYGIGTRKTERPNLLAVSWREAGGPAADDPAGPWITEKLTLMETNIDDMTGEALGFLMEKLFGAGALDVTFTPCTMKKSRPGTVVSVLARPAGLKALRECLFIHSAAIGFRETEVRRLSLRREEKRLDEKTPGLGGAAVKTVFYGDKVLRSKIEFEDRARLARDKGISLDEADKLLGTTD